MAVLLDCNVFHQALLFKGYSQFLWQSKTMQQIKYTESSKTGILLQDTEVKLTWTADHDETYITTSFKYIKLLLLLLNKLFTVFLV